MSPPCRFIPEGTGILVPVYVLSRDPVNFSPDPDVFWPDRWLRADSAKRTPKTSEDSEASSTYAYTRTDDEKEEKENGKSKSDEVTVTNNAAAFIPFSYGPENCAGRNLALVEMRMVVALLIQRFEFRFAEGYDPRKWEEEIEDWMVTKLGELPVVLTCRS